MADKEQSLVRFSKKETKWSNAIADEFECSPDTKTRFINIPSTPLCFPVPTKSILRMKTGNTYIILKLL